MSYIDDLKKIEYLADGVMNKETDYLKQKKLEKYNPIFKKGKTKY